VAGFESTGDLGIWTALTPDQYTLEVLDPDPDGDGSAILYRAEIPIVPGSDHLFRIKAELIGP
jgi:hypothetical protein